jgi:hypothetical protein
MIRSGTDPLRANEKLKLFASVVANIGTALFLSAFGRWFLTGFDAWVAMWIVFSCAIIAGAIQLMALLEREAADG